MKIDQQLEYSYSEKNIPGSLHEPRVLAVDDDNHHLQDEDNRRGDEEGVSVNVVQDRPVPASQSQYHR